MSGDHSGKDKGVVSPQDKDKKSRQVASVNDLLKAAVAKTTPVASPAKTAGRSKKKTRHFVIGLLFLLFTAVPTALATFYLFFIAQDQYHSSASFAVRSVESSSGADILGMFTQTASSSTVSDSYVLLDYILSEEMVRKVDAAVGLEKAFAQRKMDFFYALAPQSGIEDKADYWQSMVQANFDHTSGILNLQVKSFDPLISQAVAQAIVDESGRLINDLSQVARNGVLRAAQHEVDIAETRLSAARYALRNYRSNVQEADPIEGAKLVGQIIASLEQQLTKLNADLKLAKSQMTSGSPRIRVLESNIASVTAQLEQERKRVGGGDDIVGVNEKRSRGFVADRIFTYEELEIEREFAEKAYTSTMASLEKARYDASAKQRFLAVFIEPTRSDIAQYPTRFLNAFLVLLAGLFSWAVLVMSYYNIRDRN